MFLNRRRMRQGGQSAVETAIVMPLNVFIILAIIQQGLIVQARVMAKYAAYRAVRVGVMNNARTDMMTNAALITLLPVLAMPTSQGPMIFPDMTSATSAALDALKAVALQQLPGMLKPVTVVVCNPTNGMISGVTESALGGTGSSNEVDFDDPRASTEYGSGGFNGGSGSFTNFMATKLAIQVQFMYPMVIPFANWIIELSFLAKATPDVLRMSVGDSTLGVNATDHTGPIYHPASLSVAQTLELYAAASVPGHPVYYAPINVSYAMRMQSNFIATGGGKLPAQNNCIHYVPSG